MKGALALVALSAALVACGTAGGGTASTCSGSQLAGTFTGVPNSAGAGNIVYRLSFRNVGTETCTLTGLPKGGVLLNKSGAKLPTHVQAWYRGRMPVLVHLAPGGHAYANARFSPDVAGTGDEMSGRCEPVAYWFKVERVKVKIAPPTSVCERGTLNFSTYSPKKS